jgi:hypothetical protein
MRARKACSTSATSEVERRGSATKTGCWWCIIAGASIMALVIIALSLVGIIESP